MPLTSVFFRFVIFCLLAMQVVLAAPQRVTCSLPRDLQEEILNKYPSTRVVTIADLSEQSRRLFQKDHGKQCPGLVNVDFYGDGRPTWAVVLIAGENPNRKADLVVAHRVSDGWELRSLETTDGTPVVWEEGPGKYDDLDGQKTIRAARPVVVFVGYGSWAVLYAWDGKAVQKVQISD